MRLFIWLLSLMFGTVVAGLVYVLADNAWVGYLGLWDPPVSNPHYELLKCARFFTAAVAGGVACGLVSYLSRKASSVVLSLACSLLCAMTVSTVWIRPRGGHGWRDPAILLPMLRWQSIAVLLPASAMATAWLISRFRATRARSREP